MAGRSHGMPRSFPIEPESGDSADAAVLEPGFASEEGVPREDPDSSFLPDRMPRPGALPSQNAVPVAPPSPSPTPTAPPPRSYAPGDALANDVDLPDRPPALQGVYKSVADRDPDRAAKILTLSRRMAQPEAYIDKSLDTVTKQSEMPDGSLFSQLEAQYPGTTKWLSDPRNMAVSHDDLHATAAHEEVIRGGELAMGLLDAAQSGYQASSLGLSIRGRLPDLNLPENAPLLQRLAKGGSEMVSDLPAMMLGGIVGAGAGSAVGGAAGTATLPVIGTIGGAGGGAIAGGLAGSFAAPAVVKKFLQEEYAEGPLIASDHPISRMYGLLKEATKQGAIGLATGVGGALPGSLAKGLLARGLISEGGRAAATLTGTAAHLGGELAGMTGAQSAEEGQLPSGQDLLENAILMGGLHAAGAATGTGLHAMVEARRTTLARNFYLALGDTAEASKLRSRMPEAQANLIDSLTKEGPLESVYLNAQAATEYFQSKKIDPDAAMAELGVTKSYEEAKATGGDVEIPLSDWATKLSAEHYRALADEIKFDPDDLSAREVRETQARAATQMEEIARRQEDQAKAQAATEPIQSPADAPQSIADQVREQLKTAGLSPEEAHFDPEVHQAFFETLGKALNVDPEELASRYPLSIERMTEQQAADVYRQKFDPDILGRIRAEVEAGSVEPGGLTRDQEGYVTGRFGTHSTFPDYMREKGYSKKGVLSAIDKLGAGKRLTDKQHAMVADLYDASGYAKEGKPDLAGSPSEPYLQAGGASEAKGRIRIGGEGSNRTFNIDLFERADRSTFLHESGHYFLEILKDVAGREDAPSHVREDYQTLRDWMGLKEGEEIGTEHHEQFARGFEKYLAEGNAPSAKLARAFDRFSRWITSIYRDLRSLNVDLSDDVRGVMDRMLASQDEIARAEKTVGLSADESSVLPDEIPAEVKEEIGDLQSRARAAAEQELMRRQMKELTSEHQRFLSEERERAKAEGEKAVRDTPLFRAIDELNGLSGKKDATRRAGKLIEALEAGKDTDPAFEASAERHGFGSGRELAEAIRSASENKTFQQEVQTFISAHMERFADLKDSAKIRDEALQIIHSEHSGELLALEGLGLRDLIKQRVAKVQEAALRKAGRETAADAAKELRSEVSQRNRIQAKIEAQAAKEQARRILSDKNIRDAGNARRYITAERQAAVRAAKAMARGDLEASAQAKREQLMNHALSAESMRNRTEADQAVSQLEKYAHRGADMLGMPYGFIRQIDQMLTRSGMSEDRGEDGKTLLSIAQQMEAEKESPDEIADRTGYVRTDSGWVQEQLPDLVERINDKYYAFDLPDSVLNGAKREFSDLSMQDLRDLRDSVKKLSDIGKNYDRFLEQFDKSDMKEAAAEFRASIEKNIGTPRASDLLPGRAIDTKLGEALSYLSRLPGAFDGQLDTILTTMHKFDGLEEGPAKKYLYRPFSEAESRKVSRMKAAMTELDAQFARHYGDKEFASYKDTRVNIDGRYFTKEEILSMALNWGNEANRDRLMRGFSWDRSKVEHIFDQNLGKKDWDFVQDTWKSLQKYWPEIVKLEMDVNGTEPKGVEPSSFTNRHGSYAGGYYPIAYDFERSTEAFKNNLDKSALYKSFSTAAAYTEQGHTKARASVVTRPLRLSLDVLRNHHEDVIHDLEFRRAVIDANRFLNQRDVKTSITNAVGVRGYQGIQDWLRSVAGGSSEPITAMDQFFRWCRFKSTFFNLGYRIVTAPKIGVENLVNISSELGISGAARAIKDYYIDDRGMHDTIVGKSQFMRQRCEHLDRDMGDIIKRQQGQGATSFSRYAFFVHAYLDQGMSFPLWADVYKRAVASHGDEALAVNQADEAVKRTFMSGGAIDQAAAMRGGEWKKALTVAYGYHSMMWNRFSQSKFSAQTQWVQGNKVAAAATAARSAVYQFLLPALVTVATRELMRNNQQDDQDAKAKRMISGALDELTPLKFVPVLRDIAPYAIQKAMGEHVSALHGTPMQQAAQTLIDPIASTVHSFWSGQEDPKLFEKSVNAVSMAAGIPKSINDLAFNFIDWQQGNGEATWRDAFSRRTKK